MQLVSSGVSNDPLDDPQLLPRKYKRAAKRPTLKFMQCASNAPPDDPQFFYYKGEGPTKQPTFCFSVKADCDLLKSVWECTELKVSRGRSYIHLILRMNRM